MERTELDQLEQVVNHEIKARFPPGSVDRVVVLQHGDDPVIGPGELLVRVVIPAPADPVRRAELLAEWQEAHRLLHREPGGPDASRGGVRLTESWPEGAPGTVAPHPGSLSPRGVIRRAP